MRELFRYLVAGGVNTLVGYGIFWLGLNHLGMHASTANALGYAIALCVAYALNRVFVFTTANIQKPSIFRFMIAFFVAFAINQGVLIASIQLVGLRPELAQIFAMVIYTLVFFLMNKYFVFNQRIL